MFSNFIWLKGNTASSKSNSTSRGSFATNGSNSSNGLSQFGLSSIGAQTGFNRDLEESINASQVVNHSANA
jgi:hypothetical protein